MTHLGKTTLVCGANGKILPGSIAEINYLRLGGLDQWVMIRGESLNNPPLILLHGGPGFSDTPFFRHCNAPLEKRFTIVYWDQRGTGKSFDRHIPRSSMSVEQFIADLDELVEAVCKRLGKNKVVIFGHSWGSALGVLYAARFPEKVAAYVGSGQIGDWSAAESSSYAFALTEAKRLNNRKALKELRAIGPPPYTSNSVWTERTWLQRFEGQFGLRALWHMGRVILGAPESSLFDLPNIVRGFRFSLDAMWDEVSKLNLLKVAPALQMPVFFFLGRRDHWVPPETSVAYFDALTHHRRNSCGSRSLDMSRSPMNRPNSIKRWWNWCNLLVFNKRDKHFVRTDSQFAASHPITWMLGLRSGATRTTINFDYEQ